MPEDPQAGLTANNAKQPERHAHDEASPHGEASPSGAGLSRAEVRMGRWMTFLLLWLFALVIVGGTVRLTHSGMSIPDWPIIYYGPDKTNGSILPPFNEQSWQTVYDTYHREYIHKHYPGMMYPMERVKREFWTEYSHRLLAKLFGLFYLATIAAAIISPVLRRRMLKWLLIAGGVLVAQIVLGGTVVRQHTPELLVAFHLTTAFFFIGIMVWVMLLLRRPESEPVAPRPPELTKLAWVVLLVATLQIFAGGIMAKTEAARDPRLNTWPMMMERLVPHEAFFHPDIQPPMANFTRNPILVQFVHRWLAFVVAALVLLLAWKCLRAPLSTQGRWMMRGTVFVLAAQIILGILTLLEMVPYLLGILHLWTGLVFFLLLVAILFEIRGNAALYAAEQAELARVRAREQKFEATA